MDRQTNEETEKQTNVNNITTPYNISLLLFAFWELFVGCVDLAAPDNRRKLANASADAKNMLL